MNATMKVLFSFLITLTLTTAAMSANAPNFWLPWIVIIAVAVVLLTYWFANHSRLGRQVYAGQNRVERLLAPLRLLGVEIDRNIFHESGWHHRLDVNQP